MPKKVEGEGVSPEVSEGLPSDLLKTAATPEANEPPASDKEQAVRDFMALLDANPGLGAAVADFIERYLTGGGTVAGTQAAAPAAMPAAAPAVTGMAPAGAPAAAPTDELARRLEALETARDDEEFDKRLRGAREMYDGTLRKHLPVLPDMDEQQVLQAVLKIADDPVKYAAMVYALEKALEGEGTLSERLIAKHMEGSKAAGLPKVEGPGGAIPVGAAKRPENMREAHSRAKEMLRALMGAPGAG